MIRNTLHYLDCAATTKPSGTAIEAMLHCMRKPFLASQGWLNGTARGGCRTKEHRRCASRSFRRNLLYFRRNGKQQPCHTRNLRCIWQTQNKDYYQRSGTRFRPQYHAPYGTAGLYSRADCTTGRRHLCSRRLYSGS